MVRPPLLLRCLAALVALPLLAGCPGERSSANQWQIEEDAGQDASTADTDGHRDTGDTGNTEPDASEPPVCPGPDEGYHPVATSADECALVDFLCDMGQESYFDGDCGCGCRDIACDAQDAAGEGACRAVIGYGFNGRVCAAIYGCDCVGDDCDSLATSHIACEHRFAHCLQDSCQPMDVAAEGPCDAELGVAFLGPEIGCQTLSGCDCVGDDCHLLYEEPQECIADHRRCFQRDRPASEICGSWAAQGVGLCDMILGYAFDGQECQALSGCSCVGADCSLLSPDISDCLKISGACGTDCGDPDAAVCFSDPVVFPLDCPDDTSYTVIDCEARCVDIETCEAP